MRISDLVAQLLAVKESYGDIPVVGHDLYTPIREVTTVRDCDDNNVPIDSTIRAAIFDEEQ